MSFCCVDSSSGKGGGSLAGLLFKLALLAGTATVIIGAVVIVGNALSSMFAFLGELGAGLGAFGSGVIASVATVLQLGVYAAGGWVAYRVARAGLGRRARPEVAPLAMPVEPAVSIERPASVPALGPPEWVMPEVTVTMPALTSGEVLDRAEETMTRIEAEIAQLAAQRAARIAVPRTKP